MLDPVVGTAINQDGSEGAIFSLLSFSGSSGWFLSVTVSKGLPSWSAASSPGSRAGTREKWASVSMAESDGGYRRRSLICKVVLWVTARQQDCCPVWGLRVKVLQSDGLSLLCLLAAVWSDLGQVTEPWCLLRKVSWGLSGIMNLNLAHTLTEKK